MPLSMQYGYATKEDRFPSLESALHYLLLRFSARNLKSLRLVGKSSGLRFWSCPTRSTTFLFESYYHLYFQRLDGWSPCSSHIYCAAEHRSDGTGDGNGGAGIGPVDIDAGRCCSSED